MLKLLAWIKQQTQLLCYQAARGKDPELYAELFLDNIPAGVTLETIYERLSGENAVAELASITGNAEVLQHKEWLERWRLAVMAALVDDEEAPAAGAADDGPRESVGEGGGE